MDHRRIEEENVPELYATGRLSPEDEETYEAHLMECRECREQVAWADDLRESVRTVAVAAAQETATAQLGFLVWLARRGRAVRLGLTVALLVLAGLPAWLLVEQSRLRRELTEARAAMEHPVAPPAPAQASPTADTTAKAELERLARLAQDDRNRLEKELDQERATRESLANRIAELTRPQINTAIYSLGVVRGASDSGEVELGPHPEWIGLSLELPAAEHETYRATLFDAGGGQVWQGDGLRPTASDTLNVLLYSDLLKPGEYRLQLEGMDGGRTTPAGTIAFRVR
jgi:hypothetical protein